MNNIDLLEFSNHLEIKYIDIIQEIHLEYCTKSNTDCTNSNNNYISFNVLRISKGYTNVGFGSKILTETCRFADKNNVHIELLPTILFGADLNRLIKFCNNHGFIMIGDRMIYMPIKPE